MSKKIRIFENDGEFRKPSGTVGIMLPEYKKEIYKHIKHLRKDNLLISIILEDDDEEYLIYEIVNRKTAEHDIVFVFDKKTIELIKKLVV
jgi:hypothetical protein